LRRRAEQNTSRAAADDATGPKPTFCIVAGKVRYVVRRDTPRYCSKILEIPLDHNMSDAHHTSMNVEIASRQLEALGNETRLGIYRTLVRAGMGGLSVGQIQDRVGLPASTLSHHLKRLVDQGLVRQERSGTSLICHAEYPAMSALIGFLSDECCADECGTKTNRPEALPAED